MFVKLNVSQEWVSRVSGFRLLYDAEWLWKSASISQVTQRSKELTQWQKIHLRLRITAQENPTK